MCMHYSGNQATPLGTNTSTGARPQVVFYDVSGRQLQCFDYSGDDGVREFTACAFNPSGDTAVFGTFSRFYVYTHNAIRGVWEQVRGVWEQVRARVRALGARPAWPCVPACAGSARARGAPASTAPSRCCHAA